MLLLTRKIVTRKLFFCLRGNSLVCPIPALVLSRFRFDGYVLRLALFANHPTTATIKY